MKFAGNSEYKVVIEQYVSNGIIILCFIAYRMM